MDIYILYNIKFVFTCIFAFLLLWLSLLSRSFSEGWWLALHSDGNAGLICELLDRQDRWFGKEGRKRESAVSMDTWTSRAISK